LASSIQKLEGAIHLWWFKGTANYNACPFLGNAGWKNWVRCVTNTSWSTEVTQNSLSFNREYFKNIHQVIS
jgi:hypothetical protein